MGYPQRDRTVSRHWYGLLGHITSRSDTLDRGRGDIQPVVDELSDRNKETSISTWHTSMVIGILLFR